MRVRELFTVILIVLCPKMSPFFAPETSQEIA